MSEATTTTAVEPELLTDAEYKRLVAEADALTPESINSITVNPPALQSPQMVAKQTFAKFYAALRALRVAYAEAPIDCSTTAGETAARAIWRKLVTLRTRSDKVRLEQNRVFLEQQKANNDEFGMLVDTVLPIEQRYEEAIRAKERAVEAARAKREAEAREKAAAITKTILDISAKADNLIGLSSADITARLQEVQLIELVEADLDQRFSEAVTIKDRTIGRLELALAEKQKAERDAAQVEADRKRFAIEQKEREDRAKAEGEARDAINDLNIMMAEAAGRTTEQLADDIEALEGLVFEQYQPLEAEARAVVERILPAIRQVHADKIEAAKRAEEQRVEAEKKAKEAAARERIAAMKAMVADCVGASSSAIASSIEVLDAMLMSDFEPFAKEAEEEQGRVLTALEKLRLAAKEDERTQEEKRQREERANEVQANLNKLNGLAQALQSQGFNSASVKAVSESMTMPTAAEFDGRLDEAMAAFDAQKKLLAIMFTEAEKFEAAEVERKAREERERQEYEEAQRRRAAEQAMKAREERVLSEKAKALFDLLTAVRADDNYSALAVNLRADIDGLTGDIVAALKAD